VLFITIRTTTCSPSVTTTHDRNSNLPTQLHYPALSLANKGFHLFYTNNLLTQLNVRQQMKVCTMSRRETDLHDKKWVA